MTTEHEWRRDRARFTADDAAQRAPGEPTSAAASPDPHPETEPGPLAAQFITLGQELLAVPPEAGVTEILHRVVRTAHTLVTGADVVSVTLRDPNGRFHTPVETDPVATRADQLQYDTGEGPCVAATLTPGLGLTYSPDLAHDPHSPVFGPAAAELGLHAVLATGMYPGGDPPRLGALNYYSRRPHGLDDADRDIALILAAHAAIAVRAGHAVETAHLRVAQLTSALQSRDVIGQAKGVLMLRRGCTADEAFDVLRHASQDLNVKLRDIAATVADRHTDLQG